MFHFSNGTYLQLRALPLSNVVLCILPHLFVGHHGLSTEPQIANNLYNIVRRTIIIVSVLAVPETNWLVRTECERANVLNIGALENRLSFG